MVKHLEGQAGADRSPKQVMLWNSLVQLLPWRGTLTTPGPWTLPRGPTDLAPLCSLTESFLNYACILICVPLRSKNQVGAADWLR